MKEQRFPDADGWWARKDAGRVEWFRVELVSENGEPPYEPAIFVKETSQMVDVKAFSTPLTRWWGPVLPEFDPHGRVSQSGEKGTEP